MICAILWNVLGIELSDIALNNLKKLFTVPLKLVAIGIIFSSITASGLTTNPGKLLKEGLEVILTFFVFASVAGAAAIIAALTFRTDKILNNLVGTKIDLVSNVEPSSFALSVQKILSFIPSPSVNFLLLILFSIILGWVVSFVHERYTSKISQTIYDSIIKFDHFMHKALRVVLYLSAFAIFSGLYNAIHNGGLSFLKNCTSFLAIYTGMIFVIILVMMLTLSLIHKIPFFQIFKSMLSPLEYAFVTSSSLACVDKSTEVCKSFIKKDELRKECEPFIILGATVNMPGTLSVLSMLTVSMCLIYMPEQFSLFMIFLILGKALALSVGTAAVPSASLILLTGLLTEVGISEAAIGSLIAFIVCLEFFTDRLRTMCNISSDIISSATAINFNK